MRLLPRELTTSLKKVTGEFLNGIWNGMGPSTKKRTKSPKREGTVSRASIKRAVRQHPPRRKR